MLILIVFYRSNVIRKLLLGVEIDFGSCSFHVILLKVILPSNHKDWILLHAKLIVHPNSQDNRHNPHWQNHNLFRLEAVDYFHSKHNHKQYIVSWSRNDFSSISWLKLNCTFRSKWDRYGLCSQNWNKNFWSFFVLVSGLWKIKWIASTNCLTYGSRLEWFEVHKS